MTRATGSTAAVLLSLVLLLPSAPLAAAAATPAHHSTTARVAGPPEARRFLSLAAFIHPRSAHAAETLAAAADQDADIFKERESGLRFPAHLFGGDTGLKQEVVVGGGAYQALHIKIYGVTMYIDAEAAAGSPDIRRFQGMSAEQMKRSGVWDALIHSNGFDKSLLLKLSLPVTSKAVVGAMRDTWDLSQQEKDILCEAALRHAQHTKVTSGTELMFTSLDKGNVLQMRLNGVLVDTIHMPGLADNIIRQYLGNLPVSPGLKSSVVDGLVHVLNRAPPPVSTAAACVMNCPHESIPGVCAAAEHAAAQQQAGTPAASCAAEQVEEPSSAVRAAPSADGAAAAAWAVSARGGAPPPPPEGAGRAAARVAGLTVTLLPRLIAASTGLIARVGRAL